MITDAMKAEGWIEHDGGGMPVDREVFVRVLLRDKGGMTCEPMTRRGRTGPDKAGAYHWHIDPTKPGAIIAYRVETKL